MTIIKYNHASKSYNYESCWLSHKWYIHTGSENIPAAVSQLSDPIRWFLYLNRKYQATSSTNRLENVLHLVTTQLTIKTGYDNINNTIKPHKVPKMTPGTTPNFPRSKHLKSGPNEH